MENENKNKDIRDAKPKFAFRPAEIREEDIPLAEEEKEEFSAEDGENEAFVGREPTFRERRARRREETKAAEAAEQAAFDDEGNNEDEDAPRKPRLSFRERSEHRKAEKKAVKADGYDGGTPYEAPSARKTEKTAVGISGADKTAVKTAVKTAKNSEKTEPSVFEEKYTDKKSGARQKSEKDAKESAFSDGKFKADSPDESVKKRFIPIAAAFVVFAVVCVAFSVCAAVLTRKTVTGSRVFISEIMAANSSSVPAPDGGFYDWIELCNPTDEAVDISGFGFGLDSSAAVWTVPGGTVIPANGYALVFCAGKTEYSGRSDEVYATFRLSKKGGEELTLLASSGKVIDSLKTEAVERGKTMFRRGEGKAFENGGDPTPLFPNTEEGRADYLASLYADGDPIKISEIAPKNHIGLKDSFGETSDWIEIHNTSGTAVNLKGYKLSDDASRPYSWSFPDVTIEANGFIYVFCSGRDTVAGDEIHTGFALSSKSGTVVLSRPDGGIIDSVDYSGVGKNESCADDGNGNFAATQWQTPGFENTVDGYEKYAATLKKPDGLVINEIMVGNEKYCAHNGGRYYDWAELYNASDEDIDLSGYTLSKEYSNLEMFALPKKTLRAGEYALVMFSGDKALSTSSYIHADFKIDNNGEELFLSKNGEIADAVYFSGIRSGYSFGRSGQGNGFFNLSQPTPGSSNGTGIRQISKAPFADTAEGVYDNVESVKVKLSAFGDAAVFYTTDCTEPTYKSAQYVGELTLDKTTVVKAVSYEKGKLPSAVVTLSYIVNENHTLPVISLSADPGDLFDYYRGIYADGPGYTAEFPNHGANFWQNWERDAHIAFFADGEDGFSLDCGIKMFGNYGRAYDQKPFQVKFRKKYGASELHYKLFDRYEDISVFDALVLRCGSQDGYRSRFRDELFTSLVADSDSSVLSQDYRACVLYLNGEYWGVYYIREKIDENFLAQHANYIPDSFSMLYRNGEVEFGKESGYASLIYFVETRDMTRKENYDYVCSQIDIRNYIDFKIFQAYSGNYDLHNIRYYKSTAEGADGKWRWIFYDQDYAFRDLGDSVSRTVNSETHFISNSLIRNLLKNPECRALYLSRMAELFSSSLSSDAVLAKINALYEESLPEMERHCKRWNLSLDNWKYEVDVLRRIVSSDGSAEGRSGLSYGGSRIAHVLSNLKSTLYLTDAEYGKYFGNLDGGR